MHDAPAPTTGLERLLPGHPAPMGAHAEDGGVNFAVFSDHAAAIELCLFDAGGTEEQRRLRLHGPHDGVFHGFLPNAAPGLVYGFRAHGPYAPAQGHRFNPHKLLLDPCAREIVGRFEWRGEHHGWPRGMPEDPSNFDTRDNGASALKARVARPSGMAPGRLNAPRIAHADRVLYEVHVKGFSKCQTAMPASLRGTYAGLAHPASIAHFKALGVTTLSLLPVQQAIDEWPLAARGMPNYWGYNTIGYFCADPRFSLTPDDPAAVAEEFREMVATLHAHGLEVLLDVVYNHTAEGCERGPTLSFRGLDNAAWYRLRPEDASRTFDITGCGNTVNVAHPRVTQWVLDSLRHWVHDMGVDGFRFDLATVLGQGAHGFDAQAAFFTALRQDPVLSRSVLIAEPWDAGPGGYQLGRFPGRFLEWNDKFRDSVRRYWLGLGTGRDELARRFTASSDVFHHGRRRPHASVNFVTAHDGFALADLLSHSTKHNEPNGEHNRDGRDGEPCANFGTEGPTDDGAITARRQRVGRALLATLLLSQGTPMLRGGDEIGQTQRGNNNAYCQDNDTTWFDWAGADEALCHFVGQLVVLRRSEPALRRDDWFRADADDVHLRGIDWLSPRGTAMQVDDWHDASDKAFACRLYPPTGESTRHTLLLTFNPDPAPRSFTLPAGDWQLVLDTGGDCAAPRGHELLVPGESLLVLRDGMRSG